MVRTPLPLTTEPRLRSKKVVEFNDGELVQRALEGDNSAFQRLVKRYQKKLFATAFGMIHNAEDALDIVQEAFLKVYRHLPKFQGNSSFYTWSYRIVVNLCIDFLRKEGRQPMTDFDDCILQAQEKQACDASFFTSGSSYDPQKAYNNKELGEQICLAIDTLSESHKAVISLRELQGMSYEEIATTLKCSKGTVMSRLHHARAKLRQALEEYVNRGEKIAERKKAKGASTGKQKNLHSS